MPTATGHRYAKLAQGRKVAGDVSWGGLKLVERGRGRPMILTDSPGLALEGAAKGGRAIT